MKTQGRDTVNAISKPKSLFLLQLCSSDSCPNVGAEHRPECHAAFDWHREEKRDFFRGWHYDENVTSLTDDDKIDDPSLVAWRHQNWLQLKGVPFVGNLGVYPGSGYSAELGVNLEVCVIYQMHLHSAARSIERGEDCLLNTAVALRIKLDLKTTIFKQCWTQYISL